MRDYTVCKWSQNMMIGNIYAEFLEQYKQLIDEAKRNVNNNYINKAYRGV